MARGARFAAAIAAACLAVPSAAQGAGACSSDPSAAGTWTSHGHDLANSRNQPLERRIGVATAAGLERAWVFDTGAASGNLNGGLGDFNGTPLVDGGCVFAASGSGSVVALDEATGAVVWRHREVVEPPGLGGTFAASVALSGSRVVAIVNREGAPYTIGLDRRDGRVLWRSEPLTTQFESYSNANPVVHDGVLVAGYSAQEGNPAGQGGFGLIDVRTGALLARTPTIPPRDQALGYAGGGIWTAPAVDQRSGFAFIGTGNPYSKHVEHERTNAILKVDLRRGSLRFGQVVASYKGQIDQYDQLLHDASRPTCDMAGDDRTVHDTWASAADYVEALKQFQGYFGDAHACLQFDFGFGAGVNLFGDLVGGLQKSGVYHAARRADMAPAWQTVLGLPCNVCAASSPAYDGRDLYAVVAPGTVLRAMGADGTTKWTALIGDQVHYQSVSVANGVVYTIDTGGFLDLFDAATGAALARRPLVLEAGEDTMSLSSSGVAIAGGRVIASVGSQVVAYALD
jgi:outer membrane protein assembly factor BamB